MKILEANKNQREAFNKALDRLSKAHKITVIVTESQLVMLRRNFENRFKKAIKKEKNSDRKPATKAYESFLSRSLKEQNKSLIENLVYHKVNDLTDKAFKKLTKKKI